MLLTQEIVRELLDYDPETGVLTWKPRDVKWFKDDNRYTAEQCCRRWNSKWANKTCGYLQNHYGYTIVTIDSKKYYAHRIIWLFVFGDFPKFQIDHKNGNRSDNRLRNLREVTNQQNSMNSTIYKNNTSGRKGVWMEKSTGLWVSQIKMDGKRLVVYRGGDLTEASEAYIKAGIGAGYTDRHIFGNEEATKE